MGIDNPEYKENSSKTPPSENETATTLFEGLEQEESYFENLSPSEQEGLIIHYSTFEDEEIIRRLSQEEDSILEILERVHEFQEANEYTHEEFTTAVHAMSRMSPGRRRDDYIYENINNPALAVQLSSYIDVDLSQN